MCARDSKRKTRRRGRQANDLADLAHGRRQQIELPVAFLERQEDRQLRQFRIQIAAQRRHDPDTAGAGERVERRRKPLALALVDPLVGIDFLELIDDECQMPYRRRRCRGSVPGRVALQASGDEFRERARIFEQSGAQPFVRLRAGEARQRPSAAGWPAH